jgi:hypothetical protein
MGFPIGPFFASLTEVNEERQRMFPPTSAGPGIPGGPAYRLVQDVITQHRRDWAERHLADYLRRRWEEDLLTVADQHSRHAASTGKEPTVRKFFDLAAPAADNWFGGDIYAVYGALMLKAPAPPQAHRPIHVGDERAFVNRVFESHASETEFWSASPGVPWSAFTSPKASAEHPPRRSSAHRRCSTTQLSKAGTSTQPGGPTVTPSRALLHSPASPPEECQCPRCGLG